MAEGIGLFYPLNARFSRIDLRLAPSTARRRTSSCARCPSFDRDEGRLCFVTQDEELRERFISPRLWSELPAPTVVSAIFRGREISAPLNYPRRRLSPSIHAPCRDLSERRIPFHRAC